MLQFELNDNVLHVTETLHSFSKDKVSHWYYDINTWMVSSHGKEGDTPDRIMCDESIAWVRKYYLPKVLDNT